MFLARQRIAECLGEVNLMVPAFFHLSSENSRNEAGTRNAYG